MEQIILNLYIYIYFFSKFCLHKVIILVKAEVVPAIPLRVQRLSELFLLAKANRRWSCVAEYHIKHCVVSKASSNVVLKTVKGSAQGNFSFLPLSTYLLRPVIWEV